MSENLARILTEATEASPDRIGVKLDDFEVSYRVLDDGSARLAAMLKEKDFSPGQRVGVMLPNVPYFPIAYYGVLRAGGIVVPMNVLLKPRETGFYLSDPEAKAVFAWHDFAEAAEAGAKEAGAEMIVVKPGEFEQMLGRARHPLQRRLLPPGKIAVYPIPEQRRVPDQCVDGGLQFMAHAGQEFRLQPVCAFEFARLPLHPHL